jgi:hypothetical protein
MSALPLHCFRRRQPPEGTALFQFKVLLALAKPAFTASSKLLGEPAIISVTLATLSGILITPSHFYPILRL